MKIQSVVTGDIVNSTQLSTPESKKLLKLLEGIFKGYVYEFYRGDSFQVLVKEPEQSLRIALLCRTAAKSITESGTSDVKASIGIGQVAEKVKQLGTAKGEAFVISGRGLEELGPSGEKLTIKSQDEYLNISLELVADYVNSIFGRITSRQAKVIYELLQGSIQLDVVKQLKKSKSTISQHVSSGRWHEIEKIMAQFEALVKHINK